MFDIAIVSGALVGLDCVNAVNARDLWSNLGVHTPFSMWIQRRLEEMQAVEKIDFNKFVKPNENNKLDYILSVDTAKHISMLERTETGRKVRQYFIDTEKKQAQKTHTNNPQMLLMQSLLNQLIETENEQKRQAQILSNMQDKILNIENATGSAGYYSVLAYCAKENIRINSTQAAIIGKQVANKCRELNCVIGKVPDARYGVVNTYPQEILQEVIEQLHNYSS